MFAMARLLCWLLKLVYFKEPNDLVYQIINFRLIFMKNIMKN